MSRRTGDEYRRAAARRQKQWREGQKQAGRRPFTLWLDAAAADELDRRVAEHSGAKVEAWREIIGHLLLDGGVTHNAVEQARLTELEQENFSLRQTVRSAEHTIEDQAGTIEEWQRSARETKEANGCLEAELKRAREHIQALEQAREKPGEAAIPVPRETRPKPEPVPPEPTPATAKPKLKKGGKPGEWHVFVNGKEIGTVTKQHHPRSGGVPAFNRWRAVRPSSPLDALSDRTFKTREQAVDALIRWG